MVAYSREGAYWKGLYFTWGLIRNRVFLHAIIILGLAIYINYNK